MRVKLAKVISGQHFLHASDVRKVAGRQLLLLPDPFVNNLQVPDQVLLLALLAEHRHLLLQLCDDERVHFGQSRPLYQVVQLAERRVLRQTLKVAEEILRLVLEQFPVSVASAEWRMLIAGTGR